MEATTEVYAEGKVFPDEQEAHPVFYLILDGAVFLRKREASASSIVGVLSPGDLIYAERAFLKNRTPYEAVALSDCTVQAVRVSEKEALLEQAGEPVRTWLSYRFEQARPTCARFATTRTRLYARCSALYALMTSYNTAGEQENLLKTPLVPLIEEIGKTLAPLSIPIKPILEQLSHVGLVDLRDSDMLTPTLVLPDLNLFQGFLCFLQTKEGLPTGLTAHVGKLPDVELSEDAGLLMDAILVKPEYSSRLFAPDRAMVHLSEANLQQMYREAGGVGDINVEHMAIKQLQHFGALKVAIDATKRSVFINLRNVLRLNLQRGVESNFEDITEFLCEQIAELMVRASPWYRKKSDQSMEYNEYI